MNRNGKAALRRKFAASERKSYPEAPASDGKSRDWQLLKKHKNSRVEAFFTGDDGPKTRI
jgi:hypothetical protein